METRGEGTPMPVQIKRPQDYLTILVRFSQAASDNTEMVPTDRPVPTRCRFFYEYVVLA